VPSVYQVTGNLASRWVPVIGPRHEDKEIIGFPFNHFHYDVRFMPDRLIRRLQHYLIEPGDARRALGSVVSDDIMLVAEPSVQLKRMKCYRQMPDFPWELPRWTETLKKLEAAYAACRINLDNPMCPHRGLPLVGVLDADGVVVCSGHGLSWDLRAGVLVRRNSPALGATQ